MALGRRNVLEALHRELDVKEERLLWRIEGHPGMLEQKANAVY
jgi:hypothetical protein